MNELAKNIKIVRCPIINIIQIAGLYEMEVMCSKLNKCQYYSARFRLLKRVKY